MNEMKIKRVLSYKYAWAELRDNHQSELNDIIDGVGIFFENYIDFLLDKDEEQNLQSYWLKIMEEKGWNILNPFIYTDSGENKKLGYIGPIKNGISAVHPFSLDPWSNSWMYHSTPLAVKHEVIKIPILLLPYRDSGPKFQLVYEKWHEFTAFKEYLEEAEPLNLVNPFAIIGYDDISDNLPSIGVQIHEIDSGPLTIKAKKEITRILEFPPEFHQAGLNILSFFGTYIREQYPNEKAKVKIEQEGYIVKLVIETKEGKKDIIEKALNEYQLVITGEKKPEEVTDNQGLILNLKSELRMAKYRIETQQDIMRVQGSRIDQLINIIGLGLANKPPIAIDFKPNISVSNSLTLNQDVTYALGNLNELMEMLPNSSNEYATIKDLKKSLKELENEKDPEVVKTSSAMSKFGRFLDQAGEGSENIKKIIDASESGLKILKDLAGKYNSIAEWCGLPQVPRVFTK